MGNIQGSALVLLFSILSLAMIPKAGTAEPLVLEACLTDNSTAYREKLATDAGWEPSNDAARVLSTAFILGNTTSQATRPEAVKLKSWADELAQETHKEFGKFLSNGTDVIVLVSSSMRQIESCSYVAAEPFLDSSILKPQKDKAIQENGLWRARSEASRHSIFFHEVMPDFETQIGMNLPYKMVATFVKNET